VTKRGIEEVIAELVATADDLGRPDDVPRVMVDSSLLTDIERHVEFKPQPFAAGTIPPPIGAYCLVTPTGLEDTDKIPLVSRDASGEIEIDDLLASLPDPEITLDED
jgi:hypothetical protein